MTDDSPIWRQPQSTRRLPAPRRCALPARRSTDGTDRAIPAQAAIAVPPACRRVLIISNVADLDPEGIGVRAGDLCVHLNRARWFDELRRVPGTWHVLLVRSGRSGVGDRMWFEPPCKDGFSQVFYIYDAALRVGRAWWSRYCRDNPGQCPTTGYIAAHLAREASPHLPLVLVGFDPLRSHGSPRWRGHAWAYEADVYRRKAFRLLSPSSSRAAISDECSAGLRRFALLMASYRRPEDLQRQILAMMDQDYPPELYHVFVAAKGISEFHFRAFLLPLVQHFIDAGRLTLRRCPNRGQLSNLLDTVRGCDTSGFDLFCKIDDDDIYSRLYLRTVNAFFDTLPPGSSCVYKHLPWVLRRVDAVPHPCRSSLRCCGPTQVWPQHVMAQMWRGETDADFRREVNLRFGIDSADVSFSEDRFILGLMGERGVRDIGPFARRYATTPLVTVQFSNRSVMRGGLVDPKWRRSLRDSTGVGDEPVEDVVSVLRSSGDVETILLRGKQSLSLKTHAVGEVLENTATGLIIRWQDGLSEEFSLTNNGMYELQKNMR